MFHINIMKIQYGKYYRLAQLQNVVRRIENITGGQNNLVQK